MKFSPLEIFLSALTASIISGGGAVAVGLIATKGQFEPGWVTMAAITGLISAAKDVRSLMKLPPIAADDAGVVSKTVTTDVQQTTVTKTEPKTIQ